MMYIICHLAKEGIHRLRNQYNTHAKRLRKTGEGIQGEESEPSVEVNELMVPACGPDSSTSLHAQNIWGKVGVFLMVNLNSLLGQMISYKNVHTSPFCTGYCVPGQT